MSIWRHGVGCGPAKSTPQWVHEFLPGYNLHTEIQTLKLRICRGLKIYRNATRESLMVPKKGLEPPHPCGYMDLNHARLPIPPLRLRVCSGLIGATFQEGLRVIFYSGVAGCQTPARCKHPTLKLRHPRTNKMSGRKNDIGIGRATSYKASAE